MRRCRSKNARISSGARISWSSCPPRPFLEKGDPYSQIPSWQMPSWQPSWLTHAVSSRLEQTAAVP